MPGTLGDREGTVYLAHAWCPYKHRKETVGPWHWWNVYTTHDAAYMQSARRALGWKSFGRAEVLTVTRNDLDTTYTTEIG